MASTLFKMLYISSTFTDITMPFISTTFVVLHWSNVFLFSYAFFLKNQTFFASFLFLCFEWTTYFLLLKIRIDVSITSAPLNLLIGWFSKDVQEYSTFCKTKYDCTWNIIRLSDTWKIIWSSFLSLLLIKNAIKNAVTAVVSLYMVNLENPEKYANTSEAGTLMKLLISICVL